MLDSAKDQLKDDIKAWVEKFGNNKTVLIPVLQNIQKKYNFISEYAMQILADLLDISPTDVYGVVSFYSFLYDKPHGNFVIRLCQTISCDIAGKKLIAEKLESELGIKFGETTADGKFSLEWANCIGLCDQGPAMLINDRAFTKVTPEKVADILSECRKDLLPVETFITPLTFDKIVPGICLKAALEKGRVGIIDEISASRLRGRGGAGFPVGAKWNLAGATKGDCKYVVCNADEGEPGTFKDRVLLTEYQDILLEGMTIAGYAVGAKKGYIYLRSEYIYLKDSLEQAIAKRHVHNQLGKNILGKTDFDFDIKIRLGAGAYICGEETALIESMEGKRGEPRNRPPFPVNTGFDNNPTVVNNVETLMWCVAIINNGADWFRKIGTEHSAGLKIFSISGDCRKPGIYEFPLGITVSELLKAVDARNTKAVQIGGASGFCVTADEFERKIAYEDISTGGSVIIFNQTRDMLKVAENFLEFFVEESCGQCVPCREGNVKLLEGVRKLKKRECSSEYLKELIKLGETMRDTSKCGLGQSSPNAFLSIVNGFRNEFIQE
jgi:[NiFe] hydrogenase diaphorase moiety large subunit